MADFSGIGGDLPKRFEVLGIFTAEVSAEITEHAEIFSIVEISAVSACSAVNPDQ
jgi:hypothetical protein